MTRNAFLQNGGSKDKGLRQNLEKPQFLFGAEAAPMVFLLQLRDLELQRKEPLLKSEATKTGQNLTLLFQFERSSFKRQSW